MSRIWAPAATISRARVRALSKVVYFPPSEKESGVVFKIPMIHAFGPRSNLKRPNSSVKAVVVNTVS
jgi:hypothetical protein